MAEKHHSDWKGPRTAVRAIAGPASVLLICCAIYWKLVLTDQYTWLQGGDIANQVLPWFQFQAGEWHAGRLPLWDPFQWGGQPLIGQGQPGAAYPFNWILFALPLKNGWLRQTYLHWYFVLMHYMAALFAYWLCRDLKLRQLPAVLGGAAFALTGFMGSFEWPQMLNGALWAPLVFLFLLRAVRGHRPLSSAAWSGAFLGMAWLSGHHQAPIFLTLACFVSWSCLSLRGGRIDWTLLRLAGVTLIFMVFCGALQLLPAYEYGRLAVRWVGAEDPVGWGTPVPYSVHQHYSLRLVSLFGIVVPPMHLHVATYSGVVVLALASAAAASRWRDLPLRLFAAISLGGLLFSFGQNNFLHGVLYSVLPMLEKARNPSVAVYLFNFGLSILAAIGANSLLGFSPVSWIYRRLPKILTIFAVILLSISFMLALGKPEFPLDDRIVLTGLVALLMAVVLRARASLRLSGSSAVLACLALALLEFGNFAGYLLPHRDDKSRTTYLKRMADHSDIVSFLRQRPGRFRIEVDDKEIPFNFGDWHGIEAMGGYLASLTSNALAAELHSDRGTAMMNVRYSVGRAPNRAGQREVFTGATGLKVFENPEALPRSWTVHHLTDTISGDTFNPAVEAKVTPPISRLEKCHGSDEVTIITYVPGEVYINANMRCRGLLVLSSIYFPGWKATVDGRPTPIHQVNGVIQGIVVDAGSHLVLMRYEPVSVIAGGLMTALGFLSATLLGSLWRSHST